ncbi:MAG: glucosaminidase domain-containing protein [Candidatus Bathyarchaeia archaeon]
MKKIKNFINEILPGLIYLAYYDYNVLAVAGQVALETGWGTSRLYKEFNNAFSIKGKGIALETHEFLQGKYQKVLDSFKVYASKLESFIDYDRVIKQSFPHAYEVRSHLEPYVYALQKYGYATDPRYAEKILRIAKMIRDVFMREKF